jgi:hypothetical protein
VKKFLILYLAPASVVEDWKKTPADKRKAAEAKMQQEWKDWTGKNKAMFVDVGAGAGKTKRVTQGAITDTRNDIMLYSIVQAESQDAAAQFFSSHPHLQIPQASIEVVDLHPSPVM